MDKVSYGMVRDIWASLRNFLVIFSFAYNPWVSLYSVLSATTENIESLRLDKMDWAIHKEY